MSFDLVARNAWEVLQDYDFESDVFWEKGDIPWKRLRAVIFPHRMKSILKSVYESKWGSIVDSLNTMGLIESICVAEWHDRESNKEDDNDLDSDNELYMSKGSWLHN